MALQALRTGAPRERERKGPMKTSLVAIFALAVLAGAAGVGFAEEPVTQPSEERRAPEPEPVPARAADAIEVTG